MEKFRKFSLLHRYFDLTYTKLRAGYEPAEASNLLTRSICDLRSFRLISVVPTGLQFFFMSCQQRPTQDRT